MKKRNWTKILVVIAILSAIIAGVEASFYIIRESAGVIGKVKTLSIVSFVIRNVASCFAFSPSLSVTDVFKHMTTQDTDIIYQWFTVAYVVVIVVAPICTASAFYVFFGDMVRYIWGRLKAILMKKPEERVLLIGTNPVADSIIVNELDLDNAREIIYVTKQKYSRDEKLQFIKKRISLVEMDLQSCSDNDFRKTIRKISQKGINGMILAEDSEANNFSLYMRLMELCKTDIPMDINCCCRCANMTMRQLFIDYYSDHRKEGCIAPKLFSVSGMRAYSILEHMPLPVVSGKEKLKILIGGFGQTGQNFLTDAAIMGIGSSQNAIEIDVVDIDIDSRKEEFMKLFSPEVFTITDDTCTLNASAADGSLTIHFYRLDVRSGKFAELIRKNGYDYVSICIEDVDSCVQSIIEMNRIIAAQKKIFPIVVSMTSDPEVAIYLEKEKQRYKHIYITGTKGFLNADYILHTSLEDRARMFHETYRRISLTPMFEYRTAPPQTEDVESPIVRWKTMALYKQEDNRFVSRHQIVKEQVVQDYLGKEKETKLQQYFGENGTIFKCMGDSYVFEESAQELIQKINADPFLRELGAMEHRRWSYVKAITGWKYAEKKSDILQETPYLLRWDELCDRYPDMCLYDFMPLLLMMQKQ